MRVRGYSKGLVILWTRSFFLIIMTFFVLFPTIWTTHFYAPLMKNTVIPACIYRQNHSNFQFWIGKLLTKIDRFSANLFTTILGLRQVHWVSHKFSDLLTQHAIVTLRATIIIIAHQLPGEVNCLINGSVMNCTKYDPNNASFTNGLSNQ